jgi:hypothetical protein
LTLPLHNSTYRITLAGRSWRGCCVVVKPSRRCSRGSPLEEITPMVDDPDLPDGPTFKRLKDQIDYYSTKSRSSQRAFKRIKVAEIVSAAFIPFLGSLSFAWLTPHRLVLITGALGVLITILEGVLHLNNYHENWTNYRATSEALKHEKYLYLGHAGPYANAPGADSLLAERVESLVSQESAQWTARQQQSGKTQAATH